MTVRLILIAITLGCLIAGCSKKEEPTPPAPAEETTTAAPAPEPVEEATAPAAEPAPAPEEPQATKIGDKAALLEGLTYIKGDPVTFKEGQFYVVEFWATWCPPCRTTIPHLTEVQKKFKDKGVTVLGISNEKDLEKIKAFVTEQGEKMDYTVAMDGERKVSSGYMDAYKQTGIPTAFIVDGKGNVAWVGHPMNKMDEVLEQVIAGTFDPDAYAKAEAEKKAAMKELSELFQKYMADLTSGATIETTRPTAEKILECDIPMALNALAWQIATMENVDEANRDYETAMKAITKANTATDNKDPQVLDTYAMILSKTDKLKEAVAVQQKAVDLSADNERAQAELKKHLEAFQKALAEEAAAAPAE